MFLLEQAMSSNVEASHDERLKSTTAELLNLLSACESQGKKAASRERDRDLCLAVRTVFNAFVDYNAWYRLMGKENVLTTADAVIALIERAAVAVELGRIPKSEEFLNSIREKIQYVIELKNGKTMYEMLQTNRK